MRFAWPLAKRKAGSSFAKELLSKKMLSHPFAARFRYAADLSHIMAEPHNDFHQSTVSDEIS